jgi:hypothetical protein
LSEKRLALRNYSTQDNSATDQTPEDEGFEESDASNSLPGCSNADIETILVDLAKTETERLSQQQHTTVKKGSAIKSSKGCGSLQQQGGQKKRKNRTKVAM